MINNNNTYKQDKKFKNYKFSKGEDLTEQDLEAIASRSRTYYVEDANYEDYMSEEFSSFIAVANLTPEELGGSLEGTIYDYMRTREDKQ